MRVSRIKDYTEKTWFLGTDILFVECLQLLENKEVCSLVGQYGSMINVDKCLDVEILTDQLTPNIKAILKEAKKRGYCYIFFDCDIETTFN